MMQKIMNFIKDEDGLALIEYCILGGLIVVATIATIVLIGGKVDTLFTRLDTALGTAVTNSNP